VQRTISQARNIYLCARAGDTHTRVCLCISKVIGYGIDDMSSISGSVKGLSLTNHIHTGSATQPISYTSIILSRVLVIKMGFGLVIGFINHFG
jgi:hypothetical protein